jgi:hypothetical protein
MSSHIMEAHRIKPFALYRIKEKRRSCTAPTVSIGYRGPKDFDADRGASFRAPGDLIVEKGPKTPLPLMS